MMAVKPIRSRVAVDFDLDDLIDLAGTPWRRIILSERDNVWCLVDADDYAWLSETNWNVSWGSRTRWQLYAKRNIGRDRATVRMHREVMLRADPDGYGPNLFADHINGQTLDNRRANLRWATVRQNNANRRARAEIPSLGSILQGLMADHAAVAQLQEVPF